MGEILERRRVETTERIESLRRELKDAEALCGERACVYVTGSFGRRETSPHSGWISSLRGRALSTSRN